MIQNIYIKNYGDSSPLVKEGWHRPLEWLIFPKSSSIERSVYGLMAVFEDAPNWMAFAGDCTGGVTYEFFDGVNSMPFITGTTTSSTYSFNNIIVDYNDCHVSTQYRGYRQCYFKITANNQSATNFYCNMRVAHATYGLGLSSQLLDVEFNNTLIYGSMGGSIFYPIMLEQVTYNNPIVLLVGNVQEWFKNCTALERLNFNVPTLIEMANIREAFVNCKLRHLPSNLIFGNILNLYQSFISSNIEILKIDYSAATIYTPDFGGSNISILEIDGAGTKNIGNFTSRSIFKLKLNGYKLGHSLVGNSMYGVSTYESWVDSLGIANGTQTITISTLQFNSFGGIGSYVDNELFAKGYTLNVV